MNDPTAVSIPDEWLWVLPLGAIVLIAFYFLSSWATPKNRQTTILAIKNNPIHYILLSASCLGLLAFLVFVVTNGRASIEIFGIKSQWLGLCLAFLAWFAPNKGE